MRHSLTAMAVVAALAAGGSSAAYAQYQSSPGYQPSIGSPYTSGPATQATMPSSTTSSQPQGYNSTMQPSYGGPGGLQVQQSPSMPQSPRMQQTPGMQPGTANAMQPGSGMPASTPGAASGMAPNTGSAMQSGAGMPPSSGNPAMDYHGASSIYQPNYAGAVQPPGGTSTGYGRPGYIDPGNPCGYGKTCGQP